MLSVAEAAELMGVAHSTVRDLCKRNLLAGAIQEKRNAPWQIPSEAVEAWIANQKGLERVSQNQLSSKVKIPSRKNIFTNKHLRRWILGISTIIAIIVGIISIANPETGLVKVVKYYLATSTPLPFLPATEDQILFVVADFDKKGSAGYDVSNRIYERLEQSIGNNRFPNVIVRRLPQAITYEEAIKDSTTLTTLADEYNARFLIWGFYDDAGFNPAFSIAKANPISIVVTPGIMTIPIDFNDANIAAQLGLFTDTGDGKIWIRGDQKRLAEQPSENNIQAYIREALPAQMLFLCASSLSLILKNQDKLDALEIAIGAGEEVNGINYLTNTNYWRELLAKAYSWRGVAMYESSNSVALSLNDFKRAIELDPTNADFFYNRALVYYKTQDYINAIEDSTNAIHLKPDYAEAYSLRGLANVGIGEIDSGINDLDQAINLQPEQASFYNNRGFVYSDLGNYEKAIDDLTHAIDLKSDSPDAYLNRGNAYDAIGEYQKAIGDYSTAINLKPDYALAYKNRGSTYINFDFEKALADFDQAIKIQPNFAEAYIDRGTVYEKKGDYTRAIADYDRAIQITPISNVNLVKAYTNRGNAYTNLGTYDQAKSDFDNAIQIEPNFEGAYISRGVLNNIRGDYQEAINDFSQALRLKPGSVEAYYNRGSAYLNVGNFDNSIFDFNQVIILMPNFADGYYGRGIAYEMKGDRDNAIADLKTFLKLSNNPLFIEKAKEKLRDLGVTNLEP